MGIKSVFFIISKFTKSIVGTFIWALLLSSVSQLEFYKMLWETTWMKPAIIFSISLVPTLLALKDYEENRREIRQIHRLF